MNKYAKFIDGELEFAPVNKGNILNFNADLEMLTADGYKLFVPSEIVEIDGYDVSYEETEIEIKELKTLHEETSEERKKRIAMLKLTRGDVFRGLLQARGITRAQLRAVIEALPTTNADGEEVTELIVKKELALIDFDEALDFYRGNALIDTVGAKLNISEQQLDMFFETNDFHYLLPQTK